ncbi:MAG: hypothetical protein JWM31_1764 [Solirubrobacterales bacterium]|nr:hypothetical protein [Solirubrobacterales bacterium]
MHSTLHSQYARAVQADRLPSRRDRLPERPEPPPGRLRTATARMFASVAGRLDREAARRAVA